MALLLWIGGTALAAYVLVVGGLYFGQRSLIYRPDTARPDLGKLAPLGVAEVKLTTTDGLSLLAWYLPPPEGAPVIVYFHGNGGHIGYRAARIEQFAAAGFGLLMPEYRGYGGNPGVPSEAGLYADAAAAFAFLAAQRVAPSRLGVWGESLGTGVAVQAAASRPIGALVLEAPYTSLADVAQDRFPFLPARLLVSDRFDSLSRIGRVTAPIFVMQAEDDTVVPTRFGHALFAAAPEPKESLFAPRGGHFAANYGGVDAAIAFLQRRIGAGLRDNAAQ